MSLRSGVSGPRRGQDEDRRSDSQRDFWSTPVAHCSSQSFWKVSALKEKQTGKCILEGEVKEGDSLANNLMTPESIFKKK